MLIVCPSCASEYALDPARIGPSGRQVRCARCREAWFVAPAPAEIPEQAAPDRGSGPSTLEGEAQTRRVSPDAPSPSLVAGRRGARKPRRSADRLGRITRNLRPLAALLLLGLLVALPAGAVWGRAGIVRALPATARLYERVGLVVNLKGLEFRRVTADVAEGEAGAAGQPPVASLVVEGEIVNVAGRPVPVPAVEIVVQESVGAPPLYTWTASASPEALEPGESARFRTRLMEPPPQGREVAVRFAPLAGPRAVAERVP